MKKKLKKIIPLILAISLVPGIIPTTSLANTGSTASGTCGNNLTWELTSDGTLTISGTGEMENYTSSSAPWNSCKNEINSVVVNSGVTSIGDCAFINCTSLISITIPDSVTSIGSFSFTNCLRLTGITLLDSLTSIGSYAFYKCVSLTSIEIPDSITSIEDDTFSSCSSLTSIEIPDSVTSIGLYAFYQCTSLISIEIPDSVTSIGAGAFCNCTSLTSIEIPDSVTSIGDVAFSNCSSLTDVYYAGSEDEWAEISIGEYNTCLTSATIHYNYIGTDDDEDEDGNEGGETSGTCGGALTWSFNGDTGMLTISGEGAMDDWDAFTLEEVPWYEYLDKIKSINVKDGVTSIGRYAFNDCENLEFVMLPSSLESIGAYAFNCYSEKFTDESIGAYAFNCYSEKFTDVFYMGDEGEWLSLTDSISEIGNDELMDAVIHYECIGRVGLYDRWSFDLYSVRYNVGGNSYYFITSADLVRLTSNLSKTDLSAVLLYEKNSLNVYQRFLVDGQYTMDEDEYPLLTSSGSCYGASAWIFLNGCGTLDASDIQSEAAYLRDVILDDDVRSAINFYYAQQYLTVNNDLTDKFMDYDQSEQLEVLADLAAESQNGGNPVLVRFQWYNEYKDDGITCSKDSPDGHTVVALGAEDGDYTSLVRELWEDGYDNSVNPLGNTEFTHRILIYDVNYFGSEDSYLYYSDDGVWCIPAYAIVSTESDSRDTIYNNGQLVLVTADSDVVNLVDYNTGELSDFASGEEDAVSYITSLFANDYSVSWNGESADISGFSVYNNTSDETINVIVDASSATDEESTSASSTAFLPDSDEYTVTSEDEELFFYLNTGNYLTMAAAAASGSITFEDDGGAAVTTDEETAAYISITANDGYTNLDWYRFEVLVEETTDISADLTDEGILISGGDLTDVIINGISDDEDACITAVFSTDEDTVLVTTDEDDELVVLIDADGDGIFETSIDYELYGEDDSTGETETSESAAAGDSNSLLFRLVISLLALAGFAAALVL